MKQGQVHRDKQDIQISLFFGACLVSVSRKKLGGLLFLLEGIRSLVRPVRFRFRFRVRWGRVRPSTVRDQK